MQKYLDHLKPWPTWISRVIQNPREAVAEIPLQTNWEVLITRAVAAGLIGGVLHAVPLFKFAIGIGLSVLISTTISSVVGIAVGAVILNLILGVMAKSPEFSRTAEFLSRLSFVFPASALLGWINPVLAFAPGLFVVWVTYHYVQIVAEVPREKAQLLCWILAFVMAQPLLFAGGLALIFTLFRVQF